MIDPRDTDLRDHILAEITRLAKEDGRPPGQMRFHSNTKITRYQTEKFYSTWSEWLAAAGFAPNQKTEQISREELLPLLAELTRRLGLFPTYRQLSKEARDTPGFPFPQVFYDRLGAKDERVAALREWAAERPEYNDVARILEVYPTPAIPKARAVSTAPLPETEVISESYIPPVVASLESLAFGSAAAVKACRALHRDPSNEFERRVGIAFQILGLTVEPMGQGYGRVADGIARCASGRWAIIYDAKAHSGGYRLKTEDRKFREYIETHIPPLRNLGIQRYYFAIVSSRFSTSDLERAQELVRLSDVKSCVFLEASALVALVEHRVKEAAAFDMNGVERLFTITRIVTKGDVERSLSR